MPIQGAEEMIKELTAANGGDPDVMAMPLREGEIEVEEPKQEQPKEEETPAAPVDEPVVEDAPQPEDDLVDDALSDDAKRRGKAFGQLRAESKELKARWEAAEKEKQELRERMARLEGRMESGPQQPQAKVEEDKEPDALLYPEDHNAWQIRQLRKENEEIKRVAMEASAFANWQREQRGVQMLESNYKAANPNEKYDDAMAFLIKKEREAKKLMNPALTDAQADEMTQNEKTQLFKSLAAQGRDPAAVLMQVAKLQGFNATATQEAPKRDLNKLADNQRRSSNLIGGSPAGAKDKKVGTDDVFNMAFKDVLKNGRELKQMVDGE